MINYEITNTREITTITELLAKEGAIVHHIEQADYHKHQVVSKGESSHEAKQYYAQIEVNGVVSEISFFAKWLNQKELQKEIDYVKAFKAAGLGHLTYDILAHSPIDNSQKRKNDKEFETHLLLTNTIQGLEPLNKVMSFDTLEDGTILSERGHIHPDYLTGVLNILHTMHSQFLFVHGDAQPKNFNILRKAIFESMLHPSNPTARYKGTIVIDFEKGSDITVRDSAEAIRLIADDLRSFLSYVNFDDSQLLQYTKDFLISIYSKFMQELGYSAEELVDYLEEQTDSFYDR